MTWLLARLTEASPWAGFAAVLASIGTSFPHIASITTGAAIGCGAVAAALKEKGAEK